MELRTPLEMAMQEVSSLNSEGIKVQGGKRYTQVVTRVEVFRKHLGFHYGIETGIFEFAGGFMAKAVIRDLTNDKIIGTGHSYAGSIAKEKSVEKFETTAIGRALASCGLSGGEYATQEELETHEDRYEKFPREFKIFQRDFLYDLAHCKDVQEVDDLRSHWYDDFQAMPGYVTDPLNDQISSRKKQIENKVSTVPAKYGFIDVEEALAFGTLAKKNIEEGPLESLENWMLENHDKLKALDFTLKAKKYNENGTPSERLYKAYELRTSNKIAAE